MWFILGEGKGLNMWRFSPKDQDPPQPSLKGGSNYFLTEIKKKIIIYETTKYAKGIFPPPFRVGPGEGL